MTVDRRVAVSVLSARAERLGEALFAAQSSDAMSDSRKRGSDDPALQRGKRPRAGKGLKILMLEDVATDAELIERTLHNAGLCFTAKRVDSRDAFIQTLEEFHPDIVLCGYKLSDFDGLSAIKLLRQRSPDLPLILGTAVLGDETAVELVKAGANDYVLKDRLARLPSAVQRALAEAEAVRARRQAEETLRLSEERYHGLVAATAQIVWTASAKGEVTEDVPTWRAFTGQTVDEIKGNGWMAALHPDDCDRIAAIWSAAVQACTLFAAEYRVRRHDGEYRHFSARGVPVMEKDGSIREWIGVCADITEQKRHEDELAKVHARMVETIEELNRRERQTAVIDELNNVLHMCNSQEEAYPLIGITATKLFPHVNGALAILVNHSHDLKTVAEWGTEHLMTSSFSLDDCWGLRRGQMHRIEGPGKGALCNHFESTPTGSYLCLPLTVRGELLGLLHLNAPPATYIDDEQHRLIVAFGDVVKLSLSNLKLYEALRIQAIRDPLTGLFNRKYLDETLQRECSQARRRKAPLSVAMLDIDQFKMLNDHCGHEAGDEVLRELGGFLRDALRTSDIACRYGGEEFVLVLLDTDIAAALPRLEQICRDIKRRRRVYRDQTLPSITMSAGLAQFPIHGTSPDELLRAADQALYAAKDAGRDRIELSTRHVEKVSAPTLQ